MRIRGEYRVNQNLDKNKKNIQIKLNKNIGKLIHNSNNYVQNKSNNKNNNNYKNYLMKHNKKQLNIIK